ncbi:ATPase-like protein [Corallococcus coralloides DSM 2259]|uniref:ATPase-like protein n=1 Tax=Corallococcus coralloides (strain ATCC 25202 / DSM 2259 / NBRC 100086 / M2) TaxID=1144275 RepID=H8MP32_CORCM|nr:AAA family ATPase [Corallococcus coralloides]AFE07582.1 ATPase-like protein [Corallococcus coralloides DSM 2259]
MLTSITVENFRGIERLHVEGLGRVNLIIGRNDSGKTALMEAMQIARQPFDAARFVSIRQRQRDPEADPKDFDEFWAPVFWRMDAQRGARIHGTSTKMAPVSLSLKKAPSGSPLPRGSMGAEPAPFDTWALICEGEQDNQHATLITYGGDQGVRLPRYLSRENILWCSPSPRISSSDIKEFSKLKQQGKDELIIELLQGVNDQVSGIELLAPTGSRIAIFVRLKREGLVPLLMLGEGMKRYFEFALSLAATDGTPIYIDEIENGLHHSILESLWTWLARISGEQNVQVFATTHSEECVQAASRAFKLQGDEGLRVIRLDKQEHETKAVVYDRDLVEAAERMGVEIRG